MGGGRKLDRRHERGRSEQVGEVRMEPEHEKEGRRDGRSLDKEGR